eukprot:CAMPEP_0119164304 /NCGR_PEP_ID=MMETSP1315-20130426/4203_1 /TAXON_ID=676789 /ORGANISM="Prasinoderma singularis, Strain RCC927" /LENGTH=36 /DNA_ID= /DNA_START= /DNA_END= /DNA_ORIENTATION=
MASSCLGAAIVGAELPPSAATTAGSAAAASSPSTAP